MNLGDDVSRVLRGNKDDGGNSELLKIKALLFAEDGGRGQMARTFLSMCLSLPVGWCPRGSLLSLAGCVSGAGAERPRLGARQGQTGHGHYCQGLRRLHAQARCEDFADMTPLIQSSGLLHARTVS